MAITALIAQVNEAESVVGDLRQRFDATALLGVPSHITILAPFMAPELVTHEVVAAIQDAVGAVPTFSFALNAVRRWAETTYLSPEPADAFVQLTRSVMQRFPDFLPYGGQHNDIVPHLTVGHGSREIADATEKELTLRFGLVGPICAACGVFTLLENSLGNWRTMHTFHLGAAPPASA